jgi:hypothetical protein
MSLPKISPSAWSLAAGVHAAVLVDDLVLLDTRADAYFCIPDAGADLSPSDGVLLTNDLNLIEALKAGGLIEPGFARTGLASAAVMSPRRAAPRNPPPPWAWRDIADIVWSTFDLLATYRGRPLHQLVQGSSGSPFRRPEPTRELLAVVARFRRWVPFAPVSSKCLLRSHMLLRLLRREGHDAQWVFGVGTWPFAAHCWLQVGDMVLDDEPERLLVYRPILVV